MFFYMVDLYYLGLEEIIYKFKMLVYYFLTIIVYDKVLNIFLVVYKFSIGFLSDFDIF